MSDTTSLTLYTTTWCGDCHRVKRWLDARGLEYDEIDIDRDAEAERRVLEINAGRRRVPTVVFAGQARGNPTLTELEALVALGGCDETGCALPQPLTSRA